jgi:hypothetical protein
VRLCVAGDLLLYMAELIFHVATCTKLSVDWRREEDEMEAAPVLYLSYARQVTGGVLHADGGAHAGRW